MVASAPMEIDVGRVIAGKYELVRLLGRGSMGEVWAAQHRTLDEHLAIKLLTRAPSPDEEVEDPATAAARFRFEAQIAAKLSRKTRHIVRVSDHGEEDGLAYLVMELLEGETLDDVLTRDRRAPLRLVAKIVTQVSRALAQAHAEGVLHRDLKPANMFLTRDEEGKTLVKLLDFGIARAVHAHRMRSAVSTAKGLVFGTPSYMSPEQALGSTKLDHRCDLWALATIAYEALCGELPVDGDDTDALLQNLCAHRIVPLRRRDPSLSPELDAFFARAFSEAIGARFQSATELAQAFGRAAGIPVETSAPTDPPPQLQAPSQPQPAVEPASQGGLAVEADAERLRRKARVRVAAVAAGASLVVLVAGLVVWRQMAPAGEPARAAVVPTAAVATGAGSVAAAIAPPVDPPSPGAATSAAPAIAVSALPRASSRAPGGPPSPAAAAAPAVAPGVPPTGAPATPPSPPPTPAKKVDRSEVF